MRNKTKIFGIIALVTLIMAGIAACDNGTTTTTEVPEIAPDPISGRYHLEGSNRQTYLDFFAFGQGVQIFVDGRYKETTYVNVIDDKVFFDTGSTFTMVDSSTLIGGQDISGGGDTWRK